MISPFVFSVNSKFFLIEDTSQPIVTSKESERTSYDNNSTSQPILVLKVSERTSYNRIVKKNYCSGLETRIIATFQPSELKLMQETSWTSLLSCDSSAIAKITSKSNSFERRRMRGC